MTTYDIEQVVPHSGAMRWIDRLVKWDEESVVAQLTIRPDAMFGDATGVPAWVGIEYMAQTIAAWAGCRARAQGRPPSIGFLLGTRRYLANVDRFEVGMVLRVEAESSLLGDNGLGMFACRIMLGERELASANVSVFEPPDPVAYLEMSEQ